MEIEYLSVLNYRAFRSAEFQFRPGINLIVGINGVGKSSVLDAIRILISRAMPQVSESKNRPMAFDNSDISVEEERMDATLGFRVQDEFFKVEARIPRDRYVAKEDAFTNLREQTYEQERQYILTPSNGFNSRKNASNRQDLVVYFSTRRSISSRAVQSKNKSEKQTVAAHADALTHRELRLREFAEWWLVQETLSKEKKEDNFDNNKFELEEVVRRFIPSVRELLVEREPEPTLTVEKNFKRLSIEQLSDGERGMLALIFDLSRRLIMANPSSGNPITAGEAVVLIDELDLHLHPRWQREIVHKLTTTFPRCQFIATTHSPQIIGEVGSKNIVLLKEGKYPSNPDQSLGMDTNEILETLMDTDSRNPKFEQRLKNISDLIEDGKFAEAQNEINDLRNGKLARDPELVRLQARLTRFQTLKDDQEEN